MGSFLFKGLLQRDGWIFNTLVETDNKGIITAITPNIKNPNGATQLNVLAIPAFQNAHSHAFQYAMAGLAEVHAVSSVSDDFWSWREAMYNLALRIDPDQMESIATMLYSEMVRLGYSNVAEFHYVHHDKSGLPYGNLSEMGSRLIAAAKTAGINITLIPIFYQKGGFGKEPTKGQRRFISPDIDNYLKLLSASVDDCKNYTGANIGIGIHSMRGVEPEIIAEIAKSGPQDIPFHIHIAEQLKEIEDSISYLGKRPVEWLLDNVELNERFHLVHATHLTNDETIDIARSRANVVLCPTTEGNLGDGLFPLHTFQQAGGHWSIGTDSHVSISPLEELRLLDYGQRLITHKRNTFTTELQGDSGLFALEMVTESGRKAMGNYDKEFFCVGKSLNTCLIDASAPLLAQTGFSKLTSSLLYTTDSKYQWGTIVNGNLVVKEGKHISEESIRKNFTETMSVLKNRN